MLTACFVNTKSKFNVFVRLTSEIVKLLLFCLLSALLSSVHAAIVFDASQNAIVVTDFPKILPCTLRQVAEADQMFGWGKISCDAEADAYTVRCDLLVGDDFGSDTYFQIGSSNHPRESLTMQGNLLVRPWWIEGRHPVPKWYRVPQNERPVNRLTVGVRADTNITAAIYMDNRGAVSYALATGYITPDDQPKNISRYGGELQVYHSRLEVLYSAPRYVTDLKFKPADLKLSGPFQKLVQAEIVGWNGVQGLTGTAHYENEIDQSSFIACGRIIMGGGSFQNCVFKDCATALYDYGTGAELTNCVFTGNGKNYALHYCKEVLATDCVFGQTVLADTLDFLSKDKPEAKAPVLINRRHLTVLALDRSGSPVQKVSVQVMPEQPGSGILENLIYQTDSEGKTTVLVTESIKTASDTPSEPLVKSFTYTLTAAYEECSGTLTQVAPSETGREVTIIIEGGRL